MTEEQIASPADAAPRPVRLEVVADATIGYASLQNDVPLIRELRVTNDSQDTIKDVEVVVESDPPFAEGTKLRFDRLAAGESRRITPVDIRVHHSYLSGLTELERAKLKISFRAGGELKDSIEHPVEVLAYDQWAGSRALPELLAAFCMPNNPAIDVLVGKASTLLRDAANGASMNGYQSKNREHVGQQVSAIYSAIAGEDLQYANPPGVVWHRRPEDSNARSHLRRQGRDLFGPGFVVCLLHGAGRTQCSCPVQRGPRLGRMLAGSELFSDAHYRRRAGDPETSAIGRIHRLRNHRAGPAEEGEPARCDGARSPAPD